MVSDGTMSLQNGTWVDITKGKIKMENKEVKKYITCDPFYSTFINNLKYFIKPLIPKYEYEGKNYLTISIGCTGGQHRSVCVIEEIGNWLDLNGIKFDINHRDLIMNMNKHKVSS